jgi:hypothetical protein
LIVVGDERFPPPKRLGCIGADNYSEAEKAQNMFDVLMSSEFTLARLLRNFQGNSGLSEGSSSTTGPRCILNGPENAFSGLC